jgi:hypothetical protein
MPFLCVASYLCARCKTKLRMSISTASVCLGLNFHLQMDTDQVLAFRLSIILQISGRGLRVINRLDLSTTLEYE